jgi:hypothetical protein
MQTFSQAPSQENVQQRGVDVFSADDSGTPAGHMQRMYDGAARRITARLSESTYAWADLGDR